MKNNNKEYVAEAFNTIRTNMSFLGMDRQIKSILVTSSVKGEGKTMISCNIARAYSQIKQKVLLIDCDLRNPAIHTTLGITRSQGLTELIFASCEIEEDNDYSDYIVKYRENFDVIVAGFIPPNPSEILSSKRIGIILNHFRSQYDLIILDTPPILLVSDALSLKKYVDSLIFVVKYGFTTREMLKQSMQVFKVAGIKPMACIFNEIQDSIKRSMYSNFYFETSQKKRNRHGEDNSRLSKYAKSRSEDDYQKRCRRRI